MANDMAVSGTSDPYSTGVYSPGTNSKNTLTIESFFKLLSAQLANQDMTNPMDNSEMTAQLTNMAMVQSLIAISVILPGLVDPDSGKPTGVKYGRVVSVDFTQGNPVLKLEDDSTEYPMSHVLGVGQIEDPYKPAPDGEEEGEDEKVPGKPEDGNNKSGLMGQI